MSVFCFLSPPPPVMSVTDMRGAYLVARAGMWRRKRRRAPRAQPQMPG